MYSHSHFSFFQERERERERERPAAGLSRNTKVMALTKGGLIFGAMVPALNRPSFVIAFQLPIVALESKV